MITEKYLFKRFSVSNPVCFEFKRGRVARLLAMLVERGGLRLQLQVVVVVPGSAEIQLHHIIHPILVGWSLHRVIRFTDSLVKRSIICQKVCLIA